MATQTMKIGDTQITRIEEIYGPGFPVTMLLPDYDAGTLADHCSPDEVARYLQPVEGEDYALASMHSWLVQTPRSTILVDTGCGNQKNRPAMPAMHMLDLPFLETLAASGVKPADVDYVVCTHLHLDHVGWNTMLVDGEWVPTFPNATYVFNRTEFDFWNPDNPASAALEFNAGVYEDSVKPVFDREMVQLWDGDVDIDGVLHLETAPGHTPGHAIAWLESKGERALFSGDAMHSPIQVYEPSWNCGFDLDAEGSRAARRKVLEACAERDAALLPAHFAAPHAYKVVPGAKGVKPVPAI